MSVLPRWQRAALIRGRSWPADPVARRAHGRSHVAPVAPRVLVAAVDVAERPVPAGARQLRDAAAAGGVRCRATYALAELDTPAGPELVETVAVRLWWAGRAGYAVWRNGRFDVAWLFARTGFRRLGARQMLALVRGDS